MVETYLSPWRELSLKILTRRQLTREEKSQVEQAFCEGSTPLGPYKSYTELVNKLKKEGLKDLANLIVKPSK